MLKCCQIFNYDNETVSNQINISDILTNQNNQTNQTNISDVKNITSTYWKNPIIIFLILIVFLWLLFTNLGFCYKCKCFNQKKKNNNEISLEDEEDEGLQESSEAPYFEHASQENVSEDCCRICFSPYDDNEDFIAPCRCNGTSKWVHRKCLNKWRAEDCNDSFKKCSICNFTYEIEDNTNSDNEERVTYIFVIRDTILLFFFLQFIIGGFAWILHKIDKDEKIGDLYPHNWAYNTEHSFWAFGPYYATSLIFFSFCMGIFGLCIFYYIYTSIIGTNNSSSGSRNNASSSSTNNASSSSTNNSCPISINDYYCSYYYCSIFNDNGDINGCDKCIIFIFLFIIGLIIICILIIGIFGIFFGISIIIQKIIQTQYSYLNNLYRANKFKVVNQRDASWR